ncbi:pentatricopeptide repeat-containing protein [Dorcoceras hygrometricum]|uniref:Pentatricopeptide repeat-containing protein n=1 Tax=Dorcoceras hygrometricum TaxID=472368 RepID=A0A2Z7ANZ5_9LAMI|nr:pentatricopeptide repeat-containing protein [Dorcoceras hygrometricum]
MLITEYLISDNLEKCRSVTGQNISHQISTTLIKSTHRHGVSSARPRSTQINRISTSIGSAQLDPVSTARFRSQLDFDQHSSIQIIMTRPMSVQPISDLNFYDLIAQF